MENFFKSLRIGSPYFLYVCSLFITTNLFGLLCTNLLSILVFASLSVLFVAFIPSDKDFCELPQRGINLSFWSVSVFTVLFSVLVEISIVTNIFSVVSDAESGKYDNAIFAFIIISVAYTCALFGSKSLLKTSNILFFLPITILIPCIFSALTNGIGSIDAFIKIDTLKSDILKGISAFVIFIPDIRILYGCFKSSDTQNFKFVKTWMIVTILHITATGILLNLLLGKRLMRLLASPLFSVSGTSGYIKFNEIMLIIFSLCVLFRTGCKIIFIMKETNSFFNRKYVKYFLFPIIALCGIIGVFMVNDKNIGTYTWIWSILNTISFIIIPLISFFLKKSKN